MDSCKNSFLSNRMSTPCSRSLVCPSCGISATRSASILKEDCLENICEDCFQACRSDLEAKSRDRNPIVNIKCQMCGTIPSRFCYDYNADGDGLCDECGSRARGQAERTETTLRSDGCDVPDSIDDSILFVGPKESATNLAILNERNISLVIVCGWYLPEYLDSPSIRYHRIPISDTSGEQLGRYLPYVLDLISSAAANGNATLVHCNAGKSRSGSVAVAWLMKKKHISLQDALEIAQSRRPIITVGNFVKDLTAMED